MRPNKSVSNYMWSRYYSEHGEVAITHSQDGNIHTVTRSKDSCTEMYVVSGKDAFNKAKKAFKKWIDIEIS